jgi:hypothetical protein
MVHAVRDPFGYLHSIWTHASCVWSVDNVWSANALTFATNLSVSKRQPRVPGVGPLRPAIVTCCAEEEEINKWKNNSNTNCVLLTTTNRRRRRESKATATMTLVLLACCGTWVLCACCWGLQAFPPFSYTYYLLAKIHYGSPFQPSLLPADNSIGPNAERFWMGRNSLLVLRLGFNTGMLGQPRPK